MKRIQGSKSVICSKHELNMIIDLFLWGAYDKTYNELPLFSLQPEAKHYKKIDSDYVLIRPNNRKLTQTFFDRINKTWSKMYE